MPTCTATDPPCQPIALDGFLATEFGTDRKFEPSNGVIQRMTGGTERHACARGNLVARFVRPCADRDRITAPT